MKRMLSSPFSSKKNIIINGPNFNILIPLQDLTDHFYDTGIYAVDTKFSKHWKVNHPYMNKMSFPENENKPSRTIVATRIAHSRESIIYKSELKRNGDGEFRLPTERGSNYYGFPYYFSICRFRIYEMAFDWKCCLSHLSKPFRMESGVIVSVTKTKKG
jgi:DNA (cytosine-5)-methyltransferase 1